MNEQHREIAKFKRSSRGVQYSNSLPCDLHVGIYPHEQLLDVKVPRIIAMSFPHTLIGDASGVF
eukprot:6455199-Amphidinium_carterae.1